MKKLRLVAGLLLCSTLGTANAGTVNVHFENLGESTDFVFTPLWVGLHDGSFDLFDLGRQATDGLDLLARTGDASGLTAEFAGSNRVQASGIGAPGGFAGAPVIEGGETATGSIDVNDPSRYRYASFASMVIPSNDAFIGNNAQRSIRLFNNDGTWAAPAALDILGRNIYDVGGELNDAMGAAFSALGGMETETDENVTRFPDLSNFIGTGTAAGATIGAVPGRRDVIARLTFTYTPTPVPEPTTMALIGAGLLGLGMRKKRQQRA